MNLLVKSLSFPSVKQQNHKLNSIGMICLNFLKTAYDGNKQLGNKPQFHWGL